MSAPAPRADEGAEPSLHVIHVCELCACGAGGECHVPGCVFWMHDAPTGDTLAAIAGRVHTRPASSGDGGAPTGACSFEIEHADPAAPSPVPEEGLPTLQRRLYDGERLARWDPGLLNTFAEECAHLHEEVSEMFRAWRLRQDFRVRLDKDNKPQGIPMEMADVAIGLFYLAELHGFDLLEAVDRKHRFNLGRNYVDEGRQLHAAPSATPEQKVGVEVEQCQFVRAHPIKFPSGRVLDLCSYRAADHPLCCKGDAATHEFMAARPGATPEQGEGPAK